ncbi:MAG TPA: DUF2207 domain-containing protein [Candidatus Cloacimonadota bacterium]|nr:DUF2207 domain-containing protein [Candidatus Cloacimonadota bacterium]HPT71465.1 DUF2207 domain-containing protein [Candidatus Cloacimonadota bacterium]
MNKWIILVLILQSLLVFNLQAQKTYNAENYLVNLYLQNDGSILVNETVIFHFTGGPFRYVNRYVPNKKCDGLIFEKAFMDDKEITKSSTPSYYDLNQINGIRLKWHYAPIQDETHSFSFSYIVKGAYTLENGMVHLLWKPLPSEFEYSMKQALVKIHLPSELPADRISYGAEQSQSPTVMGDSLLVYEYPDLAPNSVKRIDLRFPENLIQVQPPQWIKHQNDDRIMGMYLAISCLVFFVFIVFFSILSIIRRTSNYSHYCDPNAVFTDFPSQIDPATLCRLYNGPYGIATALYATLVQLAQKGVISIVSTHKKKWYETYGGLNFTFLENQTELTSIEQLVIDVVFGNPPTTNPIDLIQLQTILRKNSRYFQKSIEEDLIRNGFIDSDKLAKRKKILFIGILITLVDFAALVGSLAYFKEISPSILIPFVAVFLTGIILLVVGGMKMIFTEAAMTELACWNIYKTTIKRRMKDPMGEGDANEFNRVFPYTLAMNLGREWVSYFKKNGVDVGNTWLQYDSNSSDAWAPYVLISTISSPTSGSTSGGGSAGGGGGGGGSSSAG